MRQEIGEFDLADRQLLPAGNQSKSGVWTDIGEAKVTHTLFGRARVRIVRRHDRVRRTVLLTALAVTALAAAAWELWTASQQAEPRKNVEAPFSASVQDRAPAAQAEYLFPPVTPSAEPRAMAVPAPGGPVPAAKAEPGATVPLAPPVAANGEPVQDQPVKPRRHRPVPVAPLAAPVNPPATSPAAEVSATPPPKETGAASPSATDAPAPKVGVPQATSLPPN